MLAYLIEALGLNPDTEVQYITFTGKASLVLNQKQCSGAITAHKFLYNARLKSDGKYRFEPKQTLDLYNDKPYLKLIVVDEVSMLPKPMWDLLLSHHIPVIAVGDPFQIPPIVATDDNHVLDTPHIFLDEVMRQAKESEIIRVSMDIREGRSLNPFDGKEVKILPSDQVVDGIYTWGDIVITATNATRYAINQVVRSKLGMSGNPQIGDKIICLQNTWDIASNNNMPLVNGTIGTISNIKYKSAYANYKGRKHHFQKSYTYGLATFTTEYGDRFDGPIAIDTNAIMSGATTFDQYQTYLIRTSKKASQEIVIPIEFNYGWAITCHKAQGSQWNKVVVQEEYFPHAKIEHARWLYTAATRAVDKLVLITKT